MSTMIALILATYLMGTVHFFFKFEEKEMITDMPIPDKIFKCFFWIFYTHELSDENY